jgi:competence protein ComEC
MSLSVHSRHSRPYLLVIIVLCVFDMLLAVVLFTLPSRVLTVAFLDVGQGDAVFVETPGGAQLLYDAGPPSGAVVRELARVMPFWDRTLDVVLLSHPDLDHVGGFPDVLARYRVGVVLAQTDETSPPLVRAGEMLARQGVGTIIPERGMVIELDDGITLEILYPISGEVFRETNSGSVVVRLSYGETSFLLSGDLPEAGEMRLVRLEGGMLASTVLKLGHHGSRTSSSEAWLRAVSPSLAVVSAGRENRYGHPHREVLDRMEMFGIPVYSTADSGSVVIQSDGTLVRRK